MKLITRVYNQFAQDSLYRNSIYLMLSTGAMAFFGFFFWIINTRLFKPDQIGIATTLISVATLISSISLLGLNNGVIRYLPTSERKNLKINTSFTLVAITSAFVALLYLIFINALSPKLFFVRENLFFAFFFVLFVIFTSLNTISESIFIAYRSSKYILIKNTLSSIVKLILPIFLIGLGIYGIFVSVGLSIMLAFSISFIFLIFKFGYLIKPTINNKVLKLMTKFSLGNYLASFLGGLPTTVLPILILNNLGGKFTAYFYIDIMIAGLLYIIPSAVSQSLFAEGSYSEKELVIHVKRSLKIISIIMFPAILIIIFFGKFVLLAFGKQYSNEGVILLQLFALSGIFVSINSIGSTILNIKHKIKYLILINFVGTGTILMISLMLIRFDLYGVGAGWIAGQLVNSILFFLIYTKKLS